MDDSLDLFLNEYIGKKFNTYEDFNTYRDEVLHVYKQKLDNNLPFPKLFFFGEDGKINAYIILSFIFFDIHKFNSLDEVYPLLNRSFFEEYKILLMLDYFGGISKTINYVFNNSFKLDLYFQYHKHISGLAEYKQNYNAKTYYKDKLNNIVKVQDICLDNIKYIVTKDFLKHNGLKKALGLFDNDIYKLIDFCYPQTFTKSEIKNVNLKQNNDVVNIICTILKDKNIEIYDLTTSMLKEYGCYISGRKTMNKLEDVKKEFCIRYNIKYFTIDYIKFRECLRTLKFNYKELSLKLGRSPKFISEILKRNYNITYNEFQIICTELSIQDELFKIYI